MNVERYGDLGLMVRGLPLRHDKVELEGLEEWVNGDDSALFLFDSRQSASQAIGKLKEQMTGEVESSPKTVHEIPVRYDGEDLDEVAAHLKEQTAEVIRRHTEPLYEVAFMGFSPGFPYLKGGDPSLALPRREMPRKRILVGSVAIGGPYSGIYSIESPGGWQILGTTSVQLFNLEEESFLMKPGDQVKFNSID